MADEDLLKKVHGLSDLELAGLLCLTSREHCLISTPVEALDELAEELQLISKKTFGLSCVVVNCHAQSTLEDFATAILISQSPTTRSLSPLRTRNDSYFFSRSPLSPLTSVTSPGTSHIANVILAKNLDRAPKAVQIQALELLRTRRIFTRTSVQAAPKQFLFVALLSAASGGQAHVTRHLNDFFFIAHWHDPEDGFAYLDEAYEAADDAETASTESVVKKSLNGDGGLAEDSEPVFTESDIATLAKLSQEVHIDVEVLRYQMNIISHIRMHRAVDCGIAPTATKHFDQLIKCLAPLHRVDYATPALVALAVRKIYLHRIRIVQPAQERSMQWGSDLEAVETLLDGVGPEDVIEDVLGMVTEPL